MNNSTFSFIDESGMAQDPRQEELGIGAFHVSQKRALALNRQLRNIFLEAVNTLNQTEETFEFKFTYITKRSLPFYQKILNTLNQEKQWKFSAIFQPRDKGPFWIQYLDLVEQIISNKGSQTILLADFINKPKKSRRDLTDILSRHPHVKGVLQIESQGTMLLQLSDILLGSKNFLRLNAKDQYKSIVADHACEILNKKGRAGIDPI